MAGDVITLLGLLTLPPCAESCSCIQRAEAPAERPQRQTEWDAGDLLAWENER